MFYSDDAPGTASFCSRSVSGGHGGIIGWGLIAAAAAALVGLIAPAHAADFRPGRLIVRTKASPAPAAVAALYDGLSARVERTVGRSAAIQILTLPAHVPVPQAIAALRRSGLVEYAEPDFLLRTQATPNDFRYYNGDQWNLHNTGQYGGVPGADVSAAEAWDVRTDATGVVVAVIDTGIRYTHEDLAANMWANPGESGVDSRGRSKRTNGVDDDANGWIDDVHGINTIADTGDPNDDFGHGSHVAGIIGAVGNNTVGVAGVAWRVRLMALKFLDASGVGSISDAIVCLDYAATHGAKVINASWGSYDFHSLALRDTIAALADDGVILVAAAGNNGTDNDATPLYPASYDFGHVLAVAATDRADRRAPFSNFGRTSVDLAAPGNPVYSAWAGSNQDYRFWDGTSMAAPHVAGACALLIAQFPGDTYAGIIQRILTTTDPVAAFSGQTVTGGRLNIARALTSGTAPPPAPPAAPSELATTVVSATQVDLAWTDNSSNETGFTIERASDGVTFASVATVGANMTTYVNQGLAAQSTYTFRVRAANAAGSSTPSNTASATTPAAPPPPEWTGADIGNVAIAGTQEIGSSSITLRASGTDVWENADGFRFLYRALDGDGAIQARVMSLTQTHGWAKAGVMIRETLAANARNTAAFVTASNGVNAQIRSTPGAATSSISGPWGVAAPYWVRLVRTGTTIVAAVSGNGTTWQTIATHTVSMGSTAYIGLAVTSHNNSALTTARFEQVTVTGGGTPPPPPPSPPAAPVALAATAVSSSRIDLTWSDQATNEDGFGIERATGGGSFSLLATVSANTTAYANSGLAASTTYTYRVRATNAAGQSSYSNLATTATPAPPSLPAPTALTASAISATQVNLTWADQASTETGFRVERATGGGPFVEIAVAPANATTFSNAGLAAGTTYAYRVRATDGTLDSAYSNTSTVTTPASTPPGTWEHGDIGAVGLAGSDEASGNTITVRGSGADIWESSDGFRFVYQAKTGDCLVEAQVTSLTNTNGWAKAGVMIRGSLAANAANTFICLTPTNGLNVQNRSTTGGTTTSTRGPWGLTAPYWVRLERTGSTIVASASPDGVTWLTIATHVVSMDATVYVGFAVTAHNTAALNTAVFTDPFIR